MIRNMRVKVHFQFCDSEFNAYLFITITRLYNFRVAIILEFNNEEKDKV